MAAGVRSLAVYLMNYQMLPFGRTQEMFSDLLGFSISKATLADSLLRCYERLSEEEASRKEKLLSAPILNCDETAILC
jgi:hypothetical protein